MQSDDQSALQSDCIAWAELQLKDIDLTDPVVTRLVKQFLI